MQAITNLQGKALNWVGKLEQSEENGIAVPALHEWTAFKELFKHAAWSILKTIKSYERVMLQMFIKYKLRTWIQMQK